MCPRSIRNLFLKRCPLNRPFSHNKIEKSAPNGKSLIVPESNPVLFRPSPDPQLSEVGFETIYVILH
ncbi:hypothetical protein Trydic_g15909 [Trypoxylus dichotomus]